MKTDHQELLSKRILIYFLKRIERNSREITMLFLMVTAIFYIVKAYVEISYCDRAFAFYLIVSSFYLLTECILLILLFPLKHISYLIPNRYRFLMDNLVIYENAFRFKTSFLRGINPERLWKVVIGLAFLCLARNNISNIPDVVILVYSLFSLSLLTLMFVTLKWEAIRKVESDAVIISLLVLIFNFYLVIWQFGQENPYAIFEKPEYEMEVNSLSGWYESNDLAIDFYNATIKVQARNSAFSLGSSERKYRIINFVNNGDTIDIEQGYYSFCKGEGEAFDGNFVGMIIDERTEY